MGRVFKTSPLVGGDSPQPCHHVLRGGAKHRVTKRWLFVPVEHPPVSPAAVPLASGLDTGPCFGHQVHVLC